MRLGVPREKIAFMQDYKKSEAKQNLFAAMNTGRVRVLIGSTQTLGTGVNAQQRPRALHHLNVPWLPSDIEQRDVTDPRQILHLCPGRGAECDDGDRCCVRAALARSEPERDRYPTTPSDYQNAPTPILTTMPRGGISPPPTRQARTKA